MKEYAIIYEYDNDYTPCHLSLVKISFHKGTDKDMKVDAAENEWGDSLPIIKSTRGLRTWLNNNIDRPLALMCITENEAKASALARAILKMRVGARYTGRNPRHNNDKFHDLWFEVKV
jgi:hypothetical protein